MTVKLWTNVPQQFFDNDGAPLAGGKLFTYTAGSSTKQTTYQDSGGITSNANPIVLDSAGRLPAEVWLTAGVSYKAILTASTDTDPPTSALQTWDNLAGINDTTVTLDEWVSGPTPTYVSATSFTLVGDQTTAFHVGRRLKTTNSGGTVYSTITGSAYTTLTTVTVLNDSSSLDSGLSAVSYGLEAATHQSVPGIKFNPQSSAVNELKVANAATGANPYFSASGSDTNVGLELRPKGTGKVTLTDGTDVTKKANFDASNITTATTRTFTLPDTATKLGPSVIAVGRNISASRPSASTVSFTADELLLKDSNSLALLASSISLTVDITASGANGLDTGAEASSTWYYVWVIGKADGTIAGLLSTSSSAPTMPTGYTFKALVGAVRNDGSSNIIDFLQRGATVYFSAEQAALSNGGATTETAVSLTALIPSIAHAAMLHVDGHHTTDQDSAGTVRIRVISGSNFFSMTYEGSTASVGHDDAMVEVPNVSQNVYYLVAGTNAAASISVTGFRLPMGGF